MRGHLQEVGHNFHGICIYTIGNVLLTQQVDPGCLHGLALQSMVNVLYLELATNSVAKTPPSRTPEGVETLDPHLVLLYNMCMCCGVWE